MVLAFHWLDLHQLLHQALILFWLGREDSNLRPADSKSVILPLNYFPPLVAAHDDPDMNQALTALPDPGRYLVLGRGFEPPR